MSFPQKSSFCYKYLRFPLQNSNSVPSKFHLLFPQKANFVPSFFSFFLSKLISPLIYLIFSLKCDLWHLKYALVFLSKMPVLSPTNYFSFFPQSITSFLSKALHGKFLVKSWKSVLSSEQRGHGNPSQWQERHTKPFPSLQMTQFLCAVGYLLPPIHPGPCPALVAACSALQCWPWASLTPQGHPWSPDHAAA